MLNKKRTAIIFTANTPHLAHANLLLDSLRDKQKGNFSGDIWVISTGLSDRSKNYLDSTNVKYLVNSLFSVSDWKYWKEVARSQPEYKILVQEKSEEDSLRLAFESFRNKRMSKLIILDWVRKFGSTYDFIVLCDNDLYFQRDVHEMFDRYYDEQNKVYYWQEENEMLPGTWLWKKNYHYICRHDSTELDFGRNEINIGFIMGKPSVIYQVFKEVKKYFFSLNIELFIKYGWHDQDLVRLDRAKNPDRYGLFRESDVVHICNGGMKVVNEKYPRDFYHLKTGSKPFVIHFAGGAWESYFSIKSTYTVDPDEYYHYNERMKEYDVIRKGSFQNLFDNVTERYFTESNKISKIKNRNKWLDLSNNSKKKMLFIGWLQTKTHRSTADALPEFFKHDLYDIAILNGNLKGEAHKGLCEDFPIIIAELTRTIKDPYLVMTYGIKLPNVPEWLYDNVLKSAISEYDCTERQATALASLVYIYFSDAIDFYSPDLVCLWGFLSPWGKMIADICKLKKIPACSLEWGVLPGTVAFDFNGHMAESWVSLHSDYFNSLPLSEENIVNGRKYLNAANSSRLSRNLAQELDEGAIKKIKNLQLEGKKIILYMESNSAHSGNSLFDDERVRIHSPFYKDDRQAYNDLMDVCKKHNDWHVLYKPHPISVTRGIRTEVDEECTTIIHNGGLNEVLALSDISITILSQGSYVSLLNSVPVVLLGRSQLNSSSSAYLIDSRGALERTITDALNKGFTKEMQAKFLDHVSRVLTYYVFKADKMVDCRDSYELGRTMIDIMEGRQQEYYRYERGSYCSQLNSENHGCNDAPSVSVVMPVYNAEDYLAQCISSICNQTFMSWELICINNGSTDGSQKILEYYASRDSRIKLHFQEVPNQRLARNWGYDQSKGKYLYLIDSDDYLDMTALETLFNVAERKEADVLYFFFREVRTDFSSIRPRPRWFSYRNFFPDEKVFKLEEDHHKFFIQYPFPWAKLIRKDLVVDNQLYFDPYCSNFDDNPHNLRTLLLSNNAYVLNEQLYNFRIHDKSMTQSKNSRIVGMLDAVSIMNKIYSDFGCYDKYAKWYVPYKVHLLSWAWDLVPEEYREQYFKKVKGLFVAGDELVIHDDSVWSYYEIPSSKYLARLKRMLLESYEEFTTGVRR